MLRTQRLLLNRLISYALLMLFHYLSYHVLLAHANCATMPPFGLLAAPAATPPVTKCWPRSALNVSCSVCSLLDCMPHVASPSRSDANDSIVVKHCFYFSLCFYIILPLSAGFKCTPPPTHP